MPTIILYKQAGDGCLLGEKMLSVACLWHASIISVLCRSYAGESYAGIYVPMLTREVVKGNKRGVKPHINIKVGSCPIDLRQPVAIHHWCTKVNRLQDSPPISHAASLFGECVTAPTVRTLLC